MAVVDPGMDGQRTFFGPDWSFDVIVPPRGFVRMNFSFHALWSNVVWVYNGQSKELMQSRDNNGNGSEFVSGVNNEGFPIVLGIVAWHKWVSWTVDHPERFPWRQSRMRILNHRSPFQGSSAVDDVGFNDEGGNSFENALVSIIYVTGPV